MTARWDQLPKAARESTPRRPVRKGRWLCMKCQSILTGTWASVERHVDSMHGGGRVESVILEPDPCGHDGCPDHECLVDLGADE